MATLTVPTEEPIGCPDTAAEIWMLDTESVEHSRLSSGALKSLSDAEQLRYQRFRFDRDKRAYMISHIFLRYVLSLYAPVEPGSWRFGQNDYGRPEIVGSPAHYGLRFNLTHTHGLSACIVTRHVACGIDAERIDRHAAVEALARRMFTAEEIDYVLAKRTTRQTRFLEVWTLKEAFTKAKGLGLSLSTKEFRFRELGSCYPTIDFENSVSMDEEIWGFLSFCTDTGHRVAIAVEQEASASSRYRIGWFDVSSMIASN